MRNTIGCVIISIWCLFLFKSQSVSAASTTMSVEPHSGTYGKPFSISLVIDGHSDKFNAAQATVSISSGLAVKDLSFGDCNFSFLKTPNVDNPSFAGIILSTYSTKCTAYTMTLIPTAKTQATISLSKTSVRRYGDAASVLSTTSGGSYSLTAALKPPQAPSSNAQNGLYAVNVKILSSQDAPVRGASVILNGVSDKKAQQSSTDSTGTARFTDIQSGIYDAVVMQNNNKIGEAIINISGQNHIINFAINLKTQENNSIMKNKGAVLGMATQSPYLFAVILVCVASIGAVVGIVVNKSARKATADNV